VGELLHLCKTSRLFASPTFPEGSPEMTWSNWCPWLPFPMTCNFTTRTMACLSVRCALHYRTAWAAAAAVFHLIDLLQSVLGLSPNAFACARVLSCLMQLSPIGYARELAVQAFMQSENVAKKVKDRYSDCALDGQALHVQLGGTQAKTRLKSGLALVSMRGPGAVGGAVGGAGAGPRGRGGDRAGMHGY
jgi:hypothetical protein